MTFGKAIVFYVDIKTRAGSCVRVGPYQSWEAAEGCATSVVSGRQEIDQLSKVSIVVRPEPDEMYR